jgi:hypothetical protein
VTYDSVLASNPRAKLDVVLIIDGVPLLFGTRSGRVHDGANVTNPPAGTWTSSESIIRESINLGEQELDWDSLFCKPAKVSMQIASHPSWDKYFEPLRAPIGTLIGSINKTATTVTFDDANVFPEGGYVYLSAETIQLGTIADPTFTGCTRGCIALPGNNPAKHESGDLIYSQPPYMQGRRATIRIYAGHNDTDYVDWVGYRIASSPDSTPGTWSITLDDGQSNLAVKLGTGFQGAKIVSDLGIGVGISSSSSETRYIFTIDQPNSREWLYGDAVGEVMVSAPNGDTFLCEVDQIVSRAVGSFTWVDVYINASAFVPTHPNENGAAGVMSAEELYGSTLRRVYVDRGYPMRSVLRALLSREGDGTNNATWDDMVGSLADGSNPPADDEVELRMGAGLDAALVDVTVLEQFKDVFVPGWTYIHGDKPDKLLLDLLEEAAWPLGVFFLWGSNGLKCKRFQGRTIADTTNKTVDESSIAVNTEKKSVYDESQVLHTVTVDCNYAPGTDEAKTHVTVVHNRTRRMYRDTPISRAGTLTLQRKALWVVGDDVNPRDVRKFIPPGNASVNYASPIDVRQSIQRIFSKRGKPVRRYTLILPWCTILPGDRVALTHTRLRAFDGSYVNALHCDVTKVARNWNDGTVTVSVEETFDGVLIAPACRVSSWNAGTLTLTLTTETSRGAAEPIPQRTSLRAGRWPFTTVAAAPFGQTVSSPRWQARTESVRSPSVVGQPSCLLLGTFSNSQRTIPRLHPPRRIRRRARSLPITRSSLTPTTGWAPPTLLRTSGADMTVLTDTVLDTVPDANGSPGQDMLRADVVAVAKMNARNFEGITGKNADGGGGAAANTPHSHIERGSKLPWPLTTQHWGAGVGRNDSAALAASSQFQDMPYVFSTGATHEKVAAWYWPIWVPPAWVGCDVFCKVGIVLTGFVPFMTVSLETWGTNSGTGLSAAQRAYTVPTDVAGMRDVTLQDVRSTGINNGSPTRSKLLAKIRPAASGLHAVKVSMQIGNGNIPFCGFPSLHLTPVVPFNKSSLIKAKPPLAASNGCAIGDADATPANDYIPADDSLFENDDPMGMPIIINQLNSGMLEELGTGLPATGNATITVPKGHDHSKPGAAPWYGDGLEWCLLAHPLGSISTNAALCGRFLAPQCQAACTAFVTVARLHFRTPVFAGTKKLYCAALVNKSAVKAERLEVKFITTPTGGAATFVTLQTGNNVADPAGIQLLTDVTNVLDFASGDDTLLEVQMRENTNAGNTDSLLGYCLWFDY